MNYASKLLTFLLHFKAPCENDIKHSTTVNSYHYRNSLLSNILVAISVRNVQHTVNVRTDIVVVRSKEQVCGPLNSDNGGQNTAKDIDFILLLGAFAKQHKASVRPSVRQSSWNNSHPRDRFSCIYIFYKFFKSVSKNSSFIET